MNLGHVSSVKYFSWIGVFLILIFTLIEPAALKGLGFFGTILFWTIQIGILLPLLIFVHTSLQKLECFDVLNPWVKTAFAGVLASIIFLPIALGLDWLLALDNWGLIKTQADVLALVIEESEGIIPPVVLTWIFINAPRILQLNFQVSSEPDDKKKEDLDSDLPQPAFIDQIPASLGNDIIYLASELHYIRVVTSLGETLLLCSLRNALLDIENIYEGIQTHRSYWVNKDHIDKIVGKTNNRQILTKQGFLIPISRRQLSKVKKQIPDEAR